MRAKYWHPHMAIVAIAIVFSATVCADEEPTHVYFGELHLHSSWSIDAYAFGNRVGPEDALKYARGEAITHPGGFQVQLEQPLDFTVVMEHAEYTGTQALADDPGSLFNQASGFTAALVRFTKWLDDMLLYRIFAISLIQDMPFRTLQGPTVADDAWKQLVALANRFNEAGKFTTFPGWEWTATPDFKNLHRIVFFKDVASNLQFSSLDSTDPQALWRWMDQQKADGNDVVAITHNGNLSDGALYPRSTVFSGERIDENYARARMRHEPVAEISQVKGQSETTPLLSPTDEFADFNVFIWRLLGASGESTDFGSYMRLALRDGIAMKGAFGYNPYQFGFVGGSDSHSAASAYRHDNYFGEHAAIDDTIDKRLSAEKQLNLDNRMVNPANLTGVWANENTRSAIWNAIQRKETFATSGQRMAVRLFGGWDFGEIDLTSPAWPGTAYSKGVPMGGELPPGQSESPSFIVWAEKDPTGPNLDRVQIVKGWAKMGQSFEKIYDVVSAGESNPDPTPTPAMGSIPSRPASEIGASNMHSVWVDPDFDSDLEAFYYLRALVVPAPRWTTIAANSRGVPNPNIVPATIQDRAWSSPIWYSPEPTRKQDSNRLTSAGLAGRGVLPMSSTALQDLVRGKTLGIHNLVTGHDLEIRFDTNGHRHVTTVSSTGHNPDWIDDVALVAEAPYKIENDRITTTINGSSFDMFFYRLGDRYVAARSVEYGFVNYEVQLKSRP